MIDWLIEIDKTIFEFLNGKLTHRILDFLMPIFTNAKTWIPLYIGIIIYFIYRFKVYFFIPVIGILLTFGACDYVSASLIKPNVNRIRPCNDTSVKARVVGVTCRNSPGFPSSHASNHFGIATFMILLVGTRKRFALGFWIWWASLVAYSRVYVGVHYPGDVIGGAILGIALGGLMVLITNKLIKKYI